MSLATFEDVQNRFHREIEPEDRRLIETRLLDAENKIRIRIQDLDYQMDQEPLLRDTVVRICAEAVLRLIRNPDGYVQESDGNYTYMMQQRLEEGKLTITHDEWADLGIRKKVSVIHMAPQRGAVI